MEYHQVIISIRQIIRSINLESKRIQKSFGLSLPQFLVLSFIHTHPQKRAQTKELKEYLNLNASTVTGIVVRLEKKGLLMKVAHESDRRSFYVQLTAPAHEIIDRAPASIQERLANRLKELSPEELGKLQTSLNQLIRIMAIENVEAASVLSTDDDLGA